MKFCIQSPLGTLTINYENGVIYGVDFGGSAAQLPQTPFENEIQAAFAAYFNGTAEIIALSYKIMSGTAFQRKVWHELEKIPYGTTISYQELAQRVGSVKAMRAVGSANNKNPLPLLIPCHRVIGTNGKLRGYGGGIDKQSWLLEHERKTIYTVACS